MKELPQKEEASSVRERLGETLWQFDLWSTYRVIAFPIVEIEEKEREELREVEGGRKEGIVGESINAREFFTSYFFQDCCSIIILPGYFYFIYTIRE